MPSRASISRDDSPGLGSSAAVFASGGQARLGPFMTDNDSHEPLAGMWLQDEPGSWRRSERVNADWAAESCVSRGTRCPFSNAESR
ncbi:uncharacterized protein UV8b_06716 [Ustilaginoidea virens]|uniref:Uncharacterized protein n=1 Tax=Ustilaginoidea virens TaxID=1159556 RepID=A0A8E5HVM4_USTVR|nr:uncharacterized protein UV8b_06716 [Ustilaginoidea virens]QUC22475.1 hypothetical protein UV8b_06716 [Ustilaginoidea virens]